MSQEIEGKAVKVEVLESDRILPPPAVRTEQSEAMSLIAELARDRTMPIERLKEILAMKERIDDRAREEEERQAKAAHFAAMAACQAEIKAVVVRKNRNNAQTHSRYADLAALSAAIDPIIHRHGFTTSFQPAGRNAAGEEIVHWTIAGHGHVREGTVELPVDDKGMEGKTNKTRLHGFGSTMSYGRRYLKLMLWDVATADDDDGNAGGGRRHEEPKRIGADDFRYLRELIEKAGADPDKLAEFLKVERLEELTYPQFDQAKAMLWQKVAQAKEKPDAR